MRASAGGFQLVAAYISRLYDVRLNAMARGPLLLSLEQPPDQAGLRWSRGWSRLITR